MTPKRETEFLCQLGIARLDQDRPIGKDNGGDAAIAVVDSPDEFITFGMFIKIYVFVVNAMLIEKTFGAAAIRTPVGAIHDDLISHGPSAEETRKEEKSLQKK
jgi:hypothetical protein